VTFRARSGAGHQDGGNQWSKEYPKITLKSNQSYSIIRTSDHFPGFAFLYMFVAEEFEVYSMDKEASLPEICRRLFKRTHHSPSS
jgi:hypothetical protein